MDKGIKQSTISQLFLPLFNQQIMEYIQNQGLDRYSKKLTTSQLLRIIVYAQLEQHKGLRQISNSLNHDAFSNAIGLDSIHSSTLSRRLSKLPCELLHRSFKFVLDQLKKEKGVQREISNLLLIDSSTVSLCLSKYHFAEFRKTKAGIKLHLRLRFCDDEAFPDKAIITSAKLSDKSQMNSLVLDSDALYVFDRAYVDYKEFDIYCSKAIRFVTRLKENALVKIIRNNSVNPESMIYKDQFVILGKSNVTEMSYPLRLIETTDSKGNVVMLISNDLTLNAEEIGSIYRNRWQIELFFKWIKQHLNIKHFYGLSNQAVENQVMIALITYCLLKMLNEKTGYKGTLLMFKRLLGESYFDLIEVFVQKLHRPPKRESHGRRKIDYEKIFDLTMRQVELGEVEYLNDLTYDPIIL